MRPDHEVSHGTRLKKRTEDDTALASQSRRIWRQVGITGGRAHDGMIMGGVEPDAPPDKF